MLKHRPVKRYAPRHPKVTTTSSPWIPLRTQTRKRNSKKSFREKREQTLHTSSSTRKVSGPPSTLKTMFGFTKPSFSHFHPRLRKYVKLFLWEPLWDSFGALNAPDVVQSANAKKTAKQITVYFNASRGPTGHPKSTQHSLKIPTFLPWCPCGGSKGANLEPKGAKMITGGTQGFATTNHRTTDTITPFLSTTHTSQKTIHRTQHTAHSTHHTSHITQHTTHNTQHTTHNTQHNTPHTTQNTQHTNTQHTNIHVLATMVRSQSHTPTRTCSHVNTDTQTHTHRHINTRGLPFHCLPFHCSRSFSTIRDIPCVVVLHTCIPAYLQHSTPATVTSQFRATHTTHNTHKSTRRCVKYGH